MKFKIFKLYFKSPCHWGEKGLGLEKTSIILHSDTIFNAFCNAWVYLYGKENAEKFLEKQLKESDFIITSGFPFSGKTLYFPRVCAKFPFKKTSENEKEIEKERKILKSLEIIKKDLFEKWINKKEWTKEEIKKATEGIKFIKEDLIYKNKLSRVNSCSRDLYCLGVIKFQENSGVWFGIKTENEILENWIKPALRFLMDQGISAKRNWGLGRFEFEEDEVEIQTPQNSEKFLNLSLVFPKNEDLLKIKSAKWFSWNLITRGGYPVTSPFITNSSLRKPLIKMIAEGSILSKIEGEILKIPENKKTLDKINFPHFVYHYGKAFLIPVSLKEGYE